MSVKYISAVWDDTSIKNRCELLMMLALADFANDRGTCWPGIERLASLARCSERTAHECIASLIAQSKLKVELNAGPNRTNLYTLQLPQGANAAPCDDSTPTPPDSRTRSVSNHKKPSLSSEAETIYAAYPKKSMRPAGLRAINKALKDRPAAELLAATQHMAALWDGYSLTFCPCASKWFNQEQYNDDPSTWSPKADTERVAKKAVKSQTPTPTVESFA